MKKDKIISFILFVVFVLIFWEIIEFVHSTLIMKEAYHISPGGDNIVSIVVAVSVGSYLYLFKKK